MNNAIVFNKKGCNLARIETVINLWYAAFWIKGPSSQGHRNELKQNKKKTTL